MNSTTFIVIVIRLLVPLSILRWPLVGALLSLLVDALDIVIATLLERELGLPDLWRYHQLDKYLDTYYLSLEAIVAQRWLGLPRVIATALFAYRVIGVVLFEVTDIRVFLFFFPALFEFFFLFYTAVQRFLPAYELTPRRLAMWLAVLLVPKMAQEYFIHYQRALDDVVAVDVIEDVAGAILDRLRDPLG
jgi:hypothetical protein